MKKKEFVVLGIHDGHNASACLLRDGRITAAVSEERLSRVKNDFGYPRRAVEKVLEMSGLSGADIDRVALGTRFMHSAEFFQDWNWYRKGYSQQLDDMDNAKAKILARLRADVVGELVNPQRLSAVRAGSGDDGATVHRPPPRDRTCRR
ncbi:MAG: carbamoyltransferase N-terminal domain-containing protein, partial [Candidatus Omnitrophica bacterium]|nr:carbamoyltransferase N-terminal domain-containing protein [Candidatus Omnitrophota bacterium]